MYLLGVYDEKGGVKQKKNVKIKQTKSNLRSCFSPKNHRFLVCGSEEGVVYIYDSRNKVKPVLLTLNEHRSTVSCVCWNPDETYLATADSSGVVITKPVWSLSRIQRIRHGFGSISTVLLCIYWNPDETYLVSADSSGGDCSRLLVKEFVVELVQLGINLKPPQHRVIMYLLSLLYLYVFYILFENWHMFWLVLPCNVQTSNAILFSNFSIEIMSLPSLPSLPSSTFSHVL
eukprot:Pgem_evm1s16220